MSGYTDDKGRFRKVVGGSTIKAQFAECEVCGYLGAPHEPEVCERNKAWDAKRKTTTLPGRTRQGGDAE